MTVPAPPAGRRATGAAPFGEHRKQREFFAARLSRVAVLPTARLGHFSEEETMGIKKLCGACDLEHVEDYDLCAAIRSNGAPFAITEVEEVSASWTDGEDEPDFAWLLRLADGTWAAATGQHDYTGWDCQSSFGASIHPSREEAIRMGFTVNDRENLGLLLPGESMHVRRWFCALWVCGRCGKWERTRRAG